MVDQLAHIFVRPDMVVDAVIDLHEMIYLAVELGGERRVCDNVGRDQVLMNLGVVSLQSFRVDAVDLPDDGPRP